MGKTIPDYPRGLTFEKVWAGIQELKEEQRENARQMGYLHNRFGELAEHLVGPSIMEKFNERGFEFIKRARDVQIRDKDEHRILAEIDILLENNETVIAVEVKAKPKEKDVADHIERMEVLRSSANLLGDKRKY